MQEREWTWRTSDGLEIHTVSWSPQGSAACRVMIVHGLGEHITRYRQVARAFCERNIEVCGFDLRGHGRSGGRRGDAVTYERLIDDIQEYLSIIDSPGSPPFCLYGHSMGGNLVLTLALRARSHARAFIVSAPALASASPLVKAGIKIGGLLSLVVGQFRVGNGIDPADLSRDRGVVRDYKTDPLNHDRISVRLAVGLMRAGRAACRQAAQLNHPLLMIQGEQDRVVDVATNIAFARAAADHCTLVVFPGGYHEPHNDLEREAVLRTMIDWLRVQGLR